jgi:hypothetical protein
VILRLGGIDSELVGFLHFRRNDSKKAAKSLLFIEFLAIGKGYSKPGVEPALECEIHR